MSKNISNFDWLSFLFYGSQRYRSLNLYQQTVISNTYRERKIEVKLARILFQLSVTIKNLGNKLLERRIKSKLIFEEKHRYTMGWWS